MPTEPAKYVCANCQQRVHRADATTVGARAWYWHCRACYELAQERLELVEDRPDDAHIQVYRCGQCGDMRSCRPGWHTRCHVCLDERTDEAVLEDLSQKCLAFFSQDPMLGLRVGRNLAVERGQSITARVIVEATSILTVARQMATFERPGWSVIATDVWGLPWNGIRTQPTSHGTWGRHDACGTMAKLRAGSVDCPVCGPQPGSRTHQARHNEPYLLYLVAMGRHVKFGVGTQGRVREHRRGGATVVQVLRATFAEVVLAERELKTAGDLKILDRRTGKMPASFGQGTEVIGRKTKIDLNDVLPGAEDVTSWF